MSFVSMSKHFDILYIVCGICLPFPFTAIATIDFEIWIINASFVIE